jgi:hypothetical protein
MPLRAITPSVVEDFARELEQAQVGPEARRAVLVTLQSIFRRAVVWDRVRSNPIAAVRKPGGRRVKAIVPLAPATVEAIRAELVAESDARSAVLVSLLAYAGLRPEEALALRWRHVRERTLLVDSRTSTASSSTDRRSPASRRGALRGRRARPRRARQAPRVPSIGVADTTRDDLGRPGTPLGLDGKEGVAGSSPAEGLGRSPRSDEVILQEAHRGVVARLVVLLARNHEQVVAVLGVVALQRGRHPLVDLLVRQLEAPPLVGVDLDGDRLVAAVQEHVPSVRMALDTLVV